MSISPFTTTTTITDQATIKLLTQRVIELSVTGSIVSTYMAMFFPDPKSVICRKPYGGTAITAIPPSNISPRASSDLDVLIGARVKLARKARGLSQVGLAGLLGITFQQIQKYEAGRNRVSAATLYVMSRKLGVPMPFFFADIDQDGNDEAKDFNGSHQVYAMTNEGKKLIDAYRQCPASIRRSMVSLMQAAGSGAEVDASKAMEPNSP